MPQEHNTLLAIQALEVLNAAASHEYGIRVRVEIPASVDVVAPIMRAKQVLYRFRGECAPAFDHLQIMASPDDPDNELWVLKRTPPHAAAPTEAIEPPTGRKPEPPPPPIVLSENDF